MGNTWKYSEGATRLRDSQRMVSGGSDADIRRTLGTCWGWKSIADVGVSAIIEWFDVPSQIA